MLQAVSPPSYGYFTAATVVLLVIYAAGIFLGSKYVWFIKHRVYILGASVLSLVLLVTCAAMDLPNDIPGATTRILISVSGTVYCCLISQMCVCSCLLTAVLILLQCCALCES